ncbi:PKD domain-containing protein [Cystobacter fuscus]
MQALSANDVTRMLVTVSGLNITPDIQYDLVMSGGKWTGIISNIPVGDDRLFKAEAFNGSGTKLYEGRSSPVSITANATAAVVILLQQSQAPDPFKNTVPSVTALSASAIEVVPGTKVYLSVSAVDVDGDALSYVWSSEDNAGEFSNKSNKSTEWTAPGAAEYDVSVTVKDPGAASAPSPSSSR